MTFRASNRASVVTIFIPRSELLEIQVAEETFSAGTASSAVGVSKTVEGSITTILRRGRTLRTDLVRRTFIGRGSGRGLTSGAVPSTSTGTSRRSQVQSVTVVTS